MRNKIIGIFVCMLMIATGVVPVSSTISQNDGKKSSTLEIPESHIIENVPYVNQGESWYCGFACLTMIIQYYGINASLFEVLFNSGIGYSLAYKIKYRLQCMTGDDCVSVKDRQFLANVYGLNYRNWRCDDTSISNVSKWQMFWTYAKENISKNIPVSTLTTMIELPYYEKQETMRHHILLVGYNETNSTVSINDPYAHCFNSSINGAYIYIPIDSLKKAVISVDFGYFFEILEDTSASPLPKKEAFEVAHSKNMQRMKGDANAYNKEIWYSTEKAYIFGVNALRFLKHSYNIRNILMLKIKDKITGAEISWLEDCCFELYREKQDMSEYILDIVFQNTDFYPDEYSTLLEAYMLDAEANNWFLLTIKFFELESISIFRLPAILSLVKEMRDTLDVILSIEKDIIALQPSRVVS